jgi:hypothetical protein
LTSFTVGGLSTGGKKPVKEKPGGAVVVVVVVGSVVVVVVGSVVVVVGSVVVVVGSVVVVVGSVVVVVGSVVVVVGSVVVVVGSVVVVVGSVVVVVGSVVVVVGSPPGGNARATITGDTMGSKASDSPAAAKALSACRRVSMGRGACVVTTLVWSKLAFSNSSRASHSNSSACLCETLNFRRSSSVNCCGVVCPSQC